MVGVQGVGGIPEPAPERPASAKDRRREDSIQPAVSGDKVMISSEAQAAARIASLVQLALQDDVRADRVESAKQALEDGSYKNPEVLAELAKRISKYLP
ncbi:MAG: hypothetical protein AMXMBFR4_27380 [Candidatus Hydrogenedentota bacterium]